MADGIYSALSGGVVQLRRLEVLANNLANVNTAGFKRDRLIVAERPGADAPADSFDSVLDRSVVSGGSAADEQGTYPDLSQGPTIRTGNPLDVALVGEGFLALETPSGPMLTRDGRLALAGDGTLVTATGYPVAGEWGTISLPDNAETIEITPDGDVLVDGDSMGRLRIVRPTDPTKLSKLGGGLWDPGDAGVTDVEEPEVVQRFVEGSNVEPVTMLVELIQAQRSFEAGQQMIRAHKDMDDQSIRKLGTAK